MLIFIQKRSSRVGVIKSTVETEVQNKLVEFTPVTQNEVRKLISALPCKSCELDSIPTWLLKECLDELIPPVTNLVNTCLEKACVPTSFKSSLIRPHIKKHDLDANTLKNYRPVSNLPFISKVLEKVVDAQLEITYLRTIFMKNTSLLTESFIPQKLHC